uniref:Transformer n=1 Tax=Trichogramma kaykai TaxID=54128 RepID=A0ABD2VYF7_9HYME
MAAEEDDRSGVTTPKASQQERSAGGRGNGPSSTRRNRAHEGRFPGNSNAYTEKKTLSGSPDDVSRSLWVTPTNTLTRARI